MRYFSGAVSLAWRNRRRARRPAPTSARRRKDAIRGSGINNSDITVFKNIPLASDRRRLQLRWKIYNMFNHTQFATVDATARFDAQGNQVNALRFVV